MSNNNLMFFSTFDGNNVYQKENEGAINVATILKLNRTGHVVQKMGENK